MERSVLTPTMPCAAGKISFVKRAGNKVSLLRRLPAAMLLLFAMLFAFPRQANAQFGMTTINITSFTGTYSGGQTATFQLTFAQTPPTLSPVNFSISSAQGVTAPVVSGVTMNGKSCTVTVIFTGNGGIISLTPLLVFDPNSGIISFTGNTSGFATIPAVGPVISESGTLGVLTTTAGTASSPPASFGVSGANMTAGITATAPSGFEVSTDGNNFGSTVTAGSSGTIASTTIYARLLASDAGGVYNGNITLTSSGATEVDVSVGGMVSTPPTVTSVSVPANGGYPAGKNLDFAVNFLGNMLVTGTPSIPITIGSNTVNATFISGSGTTTLIFRYTTSPGDNGGITVGSAILLNGGTIITGDGSFNNAVLTLNNVGSTTGIFVDTQAPTVAGVTFTSNDGGNGTNAGAGNKVTLSFTTSEPVQMPVVNIGNGTATVTNPSGDNQTFIATYTLQSTDSPDRSGNVPYTIALTDLAGNTANFDETTAGGPQIKLYTTPTTQASNVTFTDVTTTSATLNWTPGNGNYEMVLMAPAGTTPILPVNNTGYGFYHTYGGFPFSVGSNWSIVYNNPPTSSAPVDGLSPGIAYTVMVIDYNVNTNQPGGFTVFQYLTMAGTNNPATLSTAPPPAPTIASFSPASGPAGTLVAITGSNLSSPTAFSIGGQPATVVSNDGSTLVAMVMPNATNGAVSLTTTGGTASGTGNFTITTATPPTAQQGAKLTESGGSFAQFGASVALSADGLTALMGAPQDNSHGDAVVYTWSGSAWAQSAVLTGSGSSGGFFGGAGEGRSVALSADGNTAVLGGNQDNNNEGAFWVFTRNANTWTQQGAKMVATNTDGGTFDSQGTSVSISADGNTLVEGGTGANSGNGAAWVFTRSSGAWTQAAELTGTGIGTGQANQGSSVAISADGGTVLMAGKADNNDRGAVWVFTGSAGAWTQQGAKLTPFDANTGGGGPYFGTSTALSADGNTAIIGGPADASLKGASWIFTRSSGVWSQQGSKLFGTGAIGQSQQGWSVAISADGNTAIVGGLEDNNSVGASWVFTRSGSAWTQQGSKLVGTGASGSGSQGTSVAIAANGQTAIEGASVDNGGVGAAWVFTVSQAPTAPATQASNVQFTSTDQTSTIANWTPGNGTSEAVFISQSSSGSPSPANNTTYNANPAFGSGDQIGGSGWYCVFNGTGNSVNITGLTANTAYTVMVVDYNGTAGGEQYLTTTGTGNPATLTTSVAPTTVVSITPVGTSPASATTLDYTVTFADALTTPPSNSDFSLSNSAGVTGTINSITASGTDGTTYDVNLTNVSGNGTLELDMTSGSDAVPTISNTPFSGGAYTVIGVPTIQASNVTFNNTKATSTTINWTPGNGSSEAVFVSPGSLPISLANNTTYQGNTQVGQGSTDGSGDWYCVYNGSGSSSVDVTGLNGNSSFSVMVVDYNGTPGSEQYLTAAANGNPATLTTPPVTFAVDRGASNTQDDGMGNIDEYLYFLSGDGMTDLPVGGLGSGNFSLSTTGSNLNASIRNMRQQPDGSWDISISYSGTSGGSVTLAMVNSNGTHPTVAGLPVTLFNNRIPPTPSPVINGIDNPSVSTTSTGPVSYTVHYSDNASGVALSVNTDASKVNLILTGTANVGSVSINDNGDGSSYTVTLDQITGNGAVGISLSGGTVEDDNNSLFDGGFGSSTTFNVDNPITLNSISLVPPGSTGVTSVQYTVAFSDNVGNLGQGNFTVATTSGTAAGTITNVTNNNNDTYTVTVGNFFGSGAIALELTNVNGLTNVNNTSGLVTPSLPFIGDAYSFIGAPTIQASNVTFTNVTATSATINWIPGNGNFQMVLMAPVGTPAELPVNNTGYGFYHTYGGAFLFDGGKWSIIYNNPSTTSAFVDGLSPGVAYTVMVISYNVNVPGYSIFQYLTTAGTGNPATLTTAVPPITAAISAPSSTETSTGPVTFAVTYSGGDPATFQSFLTAADLGGTTSGTVNFSTQTNGSGDNYTITVANITGNGTFSVSTPGGEARDGYGNLDPGTNSATVNVDNPITLNAITATSTAPTTGPTVQYTVTFSDYVGNLTLNNFTVATTSGNATGIINAVTNNGDNTYSVTIGNITGSGTLQLQLTNTNGLTNVNNTTGLVTPSLPFLGDTYTILPTAPSTQASNVTLTNTSQTGTTINWTPGNGTGEAVFLENSSVHGSPSPVNNTTYNANTTFRSGDQIGGTGWYCVYNGSGSSSVSITGLSAGSPYQVMVVDYDGAPGSEQYLTTSATGNPLAFPTLSAPQLFTGTASGTITACQGTASASPNVEQFSVSGNYLTDNITVTAPAGFELSLDGTIYGSSVTITQSSGSVSNVPVYARSAASDAAGAISGSAVASSSGADSQNVGLSGTVNALASVTATPANQTAGAGAATAAVNFTGTGSSYNWTNDTPGIGLAASGTGNIASFTAVNTGSSPVTATITVTPVAGYHYAYIANSAGNNVSVINTATNAVVTTIPVGTTPYGVAVSPDGSKVYVTNSGDGTVSVINTASNSVSTIPLVGGIKPEALAVSPDGSKVYVVNNGSNNVSVISTATNTLMTTIPLTIGAPLGIAVSPDGSTVYVSASLIGQIAVINTNINLQTNTIAFPVTSPGNIAISPDGSKLYLGASLSNGLVIINTGTGLSTQHPFGRIVNGGLAVSADGTKVYIGTQGGGVLVFNTINNAVTATIPVIGGRVYGVSLTADGSELYAVVGGVSTVDVINTASNTVTNTIGVGLSPQSFGNFVAGVSGCSGNPTRVTITVNPSPAITTSGTLTALSTTPGVPSVSTSINVSAAYLQSGVLVTPPTGFEVSTDNTNFGSTVTLTGDGSGTLASTPVYVRLAADPAGTYSGNVALTGTNFTEVDVPTASSTVAQPPTTVVSITPLGTSPTNATTVDYTVTFAGALTTGPSTGDFALTGTATGAINSVTTTDNIHYDVNITGVSGDGPLELDMTGASDVSPAISNVPFTGGSYTIDNTPPTGIVNLMVDATSGTTTAQVGDEIDLYFAANDGATRRSVSFDGGDPALVQIYPYYGNWLAVYNMRSTDPVGPITAVITLTDAAGNSSQTTASGLTFAGPITAPATQAGRVSFSGTTATGTTIGWTPGSGTAEAVFVSQSSSGSPSPVNNTTYSANTAFGSAGSQIGTSGWYCVYNQSTPTSGTGSIGVTGLNPNTAYTVMVVDYNGGAGSEQYLTTGGTTNPATVTTPSNDATLSNLATSDGSFGTFSSTIPGYTEEYAYDGNELTLTATPNNPNATVAFKLNDSPVTFPVTMNAGIYNFAVTVTAQDGITKQTYTVQVIVDPADPGLNVSIPSSDTYGTSTDAITASSAAGGLITYSSSNTLAAIVDNSGVIHPLSVGTTTITVTVPGTVNYHSASASHAYTVTPANLIITADSKSMIAGQPLPAFTASYNSFVNSDNAGSLTPAPTITTTATSASAPGTYPITASGAADPNYNISYLPGTLTIVASADATLSGIGLSAGTLSPAFSAVKTSYTVNVGNATSSITISPATNNANAGVVTTLNGSTVSWPASLSVGQNKFTINVTAQNGTTSKVYTVMVTRAPSANANLSSLVMSKGAFSPGFSSGTHSYTDAVGNPVSTITVTPTTADPTATILVNGTDAVTSGTASDPITLVVGSTTIDVAVKAQNGVTKTYTVTVTRAGSGNNDLSSLIVSKGAFSPVFSSGTHSYTDAVGNAVSTVTVTPTTADPTATILVNGTDAVTSGTASDPITLGVGSTTIDVAVKAQNGVTKTYTVTVTRAASDNNDLSSLVMSKGAFSPGFSSGTHSYTDAVGNPVSTVTVTPTTADPTATILVNGTDAVTSGTASDPITLVVGSTTINVVVTAQDGVTKTYTVIVTRASGSADGYNPGISVTKPTETPQLAEDGIQVHQGISPNGDGINDFLQIDNISQYPDNKLSIMNRNGQLVYEASGYDNSSKVFDGHSNKNGQMQLPGTYFYQLDYTVNGITKHKTGFIVLKY